MNAWKKSGIFAAASAVVFSLTGGMVLAQSSSSSNSYRLEEASFNSAGQFSASSESYGAQSALGAMPYGSLTSEEYAAIGGFNTSEPYLEALLTNGAMDFGEVDPSTTGSGTAQIRVRSYLSSGYVLMLNGTPPLQVGHTIAALTSPSTSAAGVEQFGVNLRANSSPEIGADPVFDPSGEFAFGAPAVDYNTANLFKYESGDIIASSDKSTADTIYTLSVIMNVSNLTPAGIYTSAISAVIVPTF